MAWTEGQLSAINLKDRNILVSAAAGSGKTAVLVERIIKRITDPDSDVSIDRLVVVTFTKAAAAEMKQRIRAALEDYLDEHPQDIKVSRQMTMVNNAPITTIDSFCLGILRNNFTDVDIDPGFRPADEGEIKLLENDVMSDLLESHYAKQDKEFLDFVDGFGSGKNDAAVVDIVMKLYAAARSHPWPDEWLNDCRKMYEVKSLADCDNNAIKSLMDYVDDVLLDYHKKFELMEKLCSLPEGPQAYAETVGKDHATINFIINSSTYEEKISAIRMASFDKIGVCRSKTVDADMKDFVKGVRDDYKKFMTSLKEKIFIKPPEEAISDIKNNQTAIKVITELATEFYHKMSEEKRDRNIIDFNDMEHLALNILVNREDGKSSYTAVSDSLSNFYDEILIDEYQDSNMLQEVILTAVSKGKIDETKNNIYMVGDVKQSIYRFRLACPDLFVEKYNRYTETESYNQKIELATNFRSRKNVLYSTNDVFQRMMNSEFGGIDYNTKTQLNPGLDYVESELNTFADKEGSTEIIVVDGENNQEIEASAAADRIKELMSDDNPYYVFEAKKGTYRRLRYSDIVILTRTVSGWADTFVNVLMNRGIPSYCENSSGYFNVYEVRMVMDFLTIVDNPLQDIPMAAAMLSYYGRFTTEQLSKIRINDKSISLYEGLLNARDSDAKVDEFLTLMEKYRTMSEVVNVYDLLWSVVFDTGYYSYIGTMPAGTRRQANVDMLLNRASSYENTSYSGLFNFLRYIDKFKKFDVDFGEATVLGENEDLVRVMSIHKSKGLEFPVVIVAGMGKKFNLRDASAPIVVDDKLGIGINVVNLQRRTTNGTLIKSAISQKIIKESISEELRVLYVAMTRAREKLIMIGSCSDLERRLKGWNEKTNSLKSGKASYTDVLKCRDYFDMVYPVAALSDEDNTGYYQIINVNSENVEIVENPWKPEKISESKNEISIPEYPYENAAYKKSKITVSELKKMQTEDVFDNSYETANFEKNHDQVSGSERGTAYHRIMECLDYSCVGSINDLEKSIDEMLNNKKITHTQREVINVEDIWKFVQSPIGKRVAKASFLKRERQFMYAHDNGQIIQGIIDMYFKEEDEYIIVDYKTDRVSYKDGEETLKKLYSIQLDYYAKALEQATGGKVKEKIIYSFTLGREIKV